jgi:hypothetical protein
MKTRSIIGFALSQAVIMGAALLCVAAPAQAYEEETVPGAACFQTFDTSTANLAHLPQGAAYNNTANAMSVTCPVQRDLVSSTGQLWVAVELNNTNSSKTTCTLYTTGSDLSVIDSETQSATFSGASALYFTNVTSNQVGGIISVSCTLPARGFIVDTYVYEY